MAQAVAARTLSCRGFPILSLEDLPALSSRATPHRPATYINIGLASVADESIVGNGGLGRVAEPLTPRLGPITENSANVAIGLIVPIVLNGPDTEHGIFADHHDNVWVTGNGR